MDKIFAIVGAPTEATMPGCSAYPNYGMVEGVNRWPARSRLRQASFTPSGGRGAGSTRPWPPEQACHCWCLALPAGTARGAPGQQPCINYMRAGSPRSLALLADRSPALPPFPPGPLQHCEARGIKDAEALNLLEQLLALNPAARVHAVKAVTVRGSCTRVEEWVPGPDCLVAWMGHLKAGAREGWGVWGLGGARACTGPRLFLHHPCPPSPGSTLQHAYFYTAPLPCQPADMPKWPSSHEMTMKRARHEARYGGGQPPRGQQGSGQPPAQRQRTQGQYGGAPGQGQYAAQQQQQQHGHQQAQGQGYRGGGQVGQQPYRGGGSGVAPAAGGAPVAGMRIPVVGGAPMMPGQIYTPQQLQQMGVQVAQATAVGMMAPAMGQQAAYGGGMQGSMGPPPNRMGPAPGSAGMHSAQPHRYGGGAQPNWSRERR